MHSSGLLNGLSPNKSGRSPHWDTGQQFSDRPPRDLRKDRQPPDQRQMGILPHVHRGPESTAPWSSPAAIAAALSTASTKYPSRSVSLLGTGGRMFLHANAARSSSARAPSCRDHPSLDIAASSSTTRIRALAAGRARRMAASIPSCTPTSSSFSCACVQITSGRLYGAKLSMKTPPAILPSPTSMANVMSTSHHEPMMRAQIEWDTHHLQYGDGE